MSVELAPLQQGVSRVPNTDVDGRLAPRIVVCCVAHFGFHLAHVQNDVLRLSKCFSFTGRGPAGSRTRLTWLYIDLTSYIVTWDSCEPSFSRVSILTAK